MRWWWGPLCTKPTRLVGFVYSPSSLYNKTPHSDTLSWFRADQSLCFLLNDFSLVPCRQQIKFRFKNQVCILCILQYCQINTQNKTKCKWHWSNSKVFSSYWNEWVIVVERKMTLFSYIMARTNCISMRWWSC
jgi:hypothetical protein